MQKSKKFQVYKSSAGSGKTFTLAQKFLGLILANDQPDYFKNILAITFTVKAANEMKERIISYLSAFSGNINPRKGADIMRQLIAENTGLTESQIKNRSAKILNRMLHQYGELSILTIDKFVHGLVRSFSSDLGLTNDFEVEIDQQQMVDRVVTRLFEMVGVDDNLTNIILPYVNYQVAQDKSWNLTSSIEHLAHQLTNEEFYTQARSLNDLTSEEVEKILSELQNRITAQEEKLIGIGSAALAEADSLGLSESDFYYGKTGIFGFMLKIKQGDLSAVLNVGARVIATIEEDKWQSKTTRDEVDVIASSWRNYYNQLEQMRDEISLCLLYQKLPSQLYQMALIGHLEQLFSEVKEEDNQQLLSDFYQILSNRFSAEHTPFIYERLGNRYHHVMIDEFQDTSKLQWQNLLPLIENSLAEGNSALIVGDAKQSIYRFRGSEPSQFINLPDVNRDSQLLFDSEFEAYNLGTNYRSHKNVIEFNNRFFHELISQELDKDLAIAYSDLNQSTHADENGSAAVSLVDTSEPDDKPLTFFNAIENQLRDVLKSGEYEQRDICLLFRTNADAANMASLLLESGYNVTSDESLLLANNSNVVLLINTWKCAQAGAERFMIQQWLASAYQANLVSENYHSFAQIVYREKWSFKQVLSHLDFTLKKQSGQQSLADTFYHYSILFNLDTADPFLKKLYDFALDFGASSQRFKSTFIEHWEKHKERLSIDAPAEVNAIQVMTIHKSKGLEFPIVIVYLPDLKLAGFTQDYHWVENEFDIPILEKLFLRTSSLKDTELNHLYEQEKSKSSLDLFNTLYVAFTRAKEQVHVFTQLQKPSKKEPNPELPAAKELSFLTKWPEWHASKKALIIQ